MKVLSLFDGIACGRVALERAGVKVDRYVAYEIDRNAIKIAQSNYPDIEEHGDVTKGDFRQFAGFDLVIGGSPCQCWSIAKSGHGRETAADGIGWALFSQFVRAWKESGARYFLYENNASMSKSIRDEITKTFGVEPIEINSELVSAQTRKRLYWTNIPGASVPADRGIKLQSILENGVVDRDKALCILRRYAGCVGTQEYLCRRYFGKSSGQLVFTEDPTALKKIFKSVKDHKFSAADLEGVTCRVRPMTVTECERLQTLPDGYTSKSGLTRTVCVAAIGNAWTVDVVAHLMKGLA